MSVKLSTYSPDYALEANTTNKIAMPSRKVEIIEDWLLGVQPKHLYTANPGEQRQNNSEGSLINKYQIHNLEDERMIYTNEN